jgi:exopolyphosphatase/pppGpp-phosphohydrolase
LPDDETAAAIGASAVLEQGIASHCRHVALLSCAIFDSLVPLHGMHSRDRFLLGCAGLLHDIGLSAGKVGHAGRGASMVMSSRTLPFDIQERCIICTMIAAHRGRKDPESLPYFTLLLPENRQRALMLASILRVADGLDFLHAGSVHDVNCTVVSDRVFFTVIGEKDMSAEKERARIKSNLFARVFGCRPVIP